MSTQKKIKEYYGEPSGRVVHTDENGYAWYINVGELAEQHHLFGSIAAGWIDSNAKVWLRPKAGNEYLPLVGDGEEQLRTRAELFRDGPLPDVEVRCRRSGLL